MHTQSIYTYIHALIPSHSFMFLSMNKVQVYRLFYLVSVQLMLSQPQATSNFAILGYIYCDVCNDNTFTKNSFFLPGADVHIECKMRASYPSTTEELSFSVNRTTDSNGTYKLELASFDCAVEFQYSFCVANLIGISSDSDCNVPALKTTSATNIAQNIGCTYTLGALSYQPETRNATLCGVA